MLLSYLWAGVAILSVGELNWRVDPLGAPWVILGAIGRDVCPVFYEVASVHPLHASRVAVCCQSEFLLVS